jgi:DNA-binding transcriptional ArsR family regulator
VANNDRAKNELRADILKALANLTRVCVIEHLKDGPHNVSDLSKELGESNSITSRHLGVLKGAGLIKDEKIGTTVIYSLASDGISDILDSVDEVIKRNYEKYKAFFQ